MNCSKGLFSPATFYPRPLVAAALAALPRAAATQPLRLAKHADHPRRSADEKAQHKSPWARSEKPVGDPAQRQSDDQRSQQLDPDAETDPETARRRQVAIA